MSEATILASLLAQDECARGRFLCNPILGPRLIAFNGEEFFANLIPALITFGFVIGVLIFIFTLLIGASEWISAGGDKARYEDAKGKITNALIGIIILFSIFAIINLVEFFFGTDLTLINTNALRI